VAAAARFAGLTDEYRTVYVEPELSALERFFAQLGGQALAQVGVDRIIAATAWPGRDLYLGLRRQLDRVTSADTRRTGLPSAMAHCLCEAPL